PPDWGDTLPTSVDIRNLGDAEATGSAPVQFYLSDDDVLEVGTDIELTGSFTVDSLGAGLVSENTDISVVLPASGTEGDYFLFVLVNGDGTVTEADDTNNSFMVPLLIGDVSTLTGVVDLLPSMMQEPADMPNLLPPVDLIWGHSYTIPVDVYNAGDTDAGAFSVSVLLEPAMVQGPKWDGSGYVLTSVPVAGLAAGSESVNDVTITLPAAGIFSDGQYHVTVVIDSEDFTTGGQVAEVFELNNIFGQPIQVVTNPALSAGADLKALELDLPDGTTGPLLWGDSYDLEAWVYNNGDADAGAFDVTVYLSTNNIYDPGVDIEIGSAAIGGGLLSTEWLSSPVSVTLPNAGQMPSGDYYLILRADSGDALTEVNESDNITSESVFVNTCVDLVADEIGLPGMLEVGWAQQYTLAADAWNIGATAAGAFDIVVAISPDAQFDPATDEILATVNVSGPLAPGEDSINDVTVTLPTAGSVYGGHTYADGQYYLIVVVDSGSAVTEAFEDNNVVSQPVQIVSTASLSGIDLTALGFDLDIENTPDDQVPSLAWNQTYTGALELELYNAGDTAASGAFDVTVRLSTDPYYEDTDTELVTLNIASLDSLLLSVQQADLTLPASGTDGAYFLVAKVDSGDAVSEALEDNNTPWALPVQVGALASGVDLAPAEFGVEQGTLLHWGEPVDVVADVRNAGDTPAGSFEVQIYFSADQTPDAGEEVHTITVNALGSNQVAWGDLTIDMLDPGVMASGDYYFIMVVDSAAAVTETDETNNTWILPVAVDGPDVDLAVPDGDFLPPAPVDILWEQTLQFPVMVENLADGPAPAVPLTVVLSDDAVFDANDEVLYTQNLPMIDGQQFMMQDVQISLPAAGAAYTGGTYADGTWYLIAKADGDDLLIEPDENNNLAVQTIEIVSTNTLQSGVDLTPLRLKFEMPQFDGQLGWGEHVPLALQLYNDGDTDAGAFDVTLALSTDALFDAGDTAVETWTIDGLASDEVAKIDLFANLPEAGALTDGTYYLVVQLDSGEGIVEADESNNAIATDSVTISLSSGIDLVPNLFALESPGAIYWGATLDVLTQIRNAGDTTSATDCTVTVYLSQADHLDGNEIELDSFTAAALAGGTVSEHARSVTLPASGTDGNYFLMLMVDSADAVAENDEQNNMFMMPVMVATSDADLAATQFEWAPEAVFVAGGLVPVTTAVTNTGSGTPMNVEVRVVLSPDANFDPSDWVVSSRVIGAIGPGATDQQSMNVAIPSDVPEGNYYLGLIVDPQNTLFETAEDNNCLSAPITVTAPRPDLQVAGAWLGPGPFFTGGPLRVDAQINNPTGTNVTEYAWRIILSGDETIDQADTILGTLTGGAAPLSNNPQFMEVTLPADLAAGTYHLAVVADPENLIDEEAEDNNIQWLALAVAEALPDLQISNFQVPAGPFHPGDVFFVTNEVWNAAEFPAGASLVSLVLSNDPQIDPSDRILAQRPAMELMPNGRDEVHTEILLPNDGTLMPGSYYLGLIVDAAGQVAEADEANNTASIPIQIEPPQIDLVVSFFQPYVPGPFFWADSFGVTADVRNDGYNEAAASQMRIVLSPDEIPDASDWLLWELEIDPLGPGQLMPNDLTIDLPDETAGLPDGTYYMIMVVDSASVIDEMQENNNTWIVPLSIETAVPPPIDLVAPNPGPMTWDMMWGRTYEIPADVFNASDGVAVDFDVTVVLSSDTLFDPADMPVAQITVDRLDPWQNAYHDVEMVLPAAGTLPDGLYYVLTYVDSAQTVDETDELNNLGVRPVNLFTPVFVAGIDLQIMEFHLDAGGGLGWGQSYQIAADFFNAGDTAAGAFQASVVLSTDTMYDPADYEVGSLELAGLASGEMSINDLTITLPAEGTLPNGPYRLIVCVDSQFGVTEADENNNEMFFLMNIGQAGVDLALVDLLAPFDAAWGDEITLDAVVENWGSEYVGPVSVAFYRSADWTLDPSDLLLETVTIAGIGAGGSATASLQYTLEDNATGEELLHIIAVVDPLNQIEEFDENVNNVQVRDIFVAAAEKPNLLAWPMIIFAPGQEDPDWGDSITLDVMIDNMSPVAAGAFSVRYYLSDDEIVDAGDLTLGRSDIAGMLPFEHLVRPAVVLALPGTSPDEQVQEWYILAKADSAEAIVESDETDNSGWAPIFIGSKPADLTGWMHFLDGGPTEIYWGEPLTFEVQIDNVGGTDAGGFNISYFFSTDPELGPDDLPAGSPQWIDALAAESTTGPLPYTVTLPDAPLSAASDMFFLLAHIDSGETVPEIDEFNNYMGDWFSADVSAADLVAFYANAGFLAHWSDAFSTNQIEVFYGLANFGNQTALDIQVDFYLVGQDGNLAEAFWLGSSTIAQMDPGMEHNDQITLDLPRPDEVGFVSPDQVDGTYLLLMQIDPQNTLPEVFEDNNATQSPLRLEALCGNLAVEDTLADPWDRLMDFGPVLAGQQASGTFHLSNQGTGPLQITEVIGAGEGFTWSWPAGETLPIDLAPGQTVALEVTFLAEADGIQEGSITVLSSDPDQPTVMLVVRADGIAAPIDLAAQAIAAPVDAFWGQMIPLSVQLANLEAVAAESQAILDLVLADTPDGPGMIAPLATRMINPLAGGGSLEEAFEVILPEVSPFGYGGQMYLRAMIHTTGGDFEVNFANNEISVPIVITSEPIGLPDLTFSGLGVPPEAVWGDQMPVELLLRNIGLADAEGFKVRCYLSKNNVLDKSDLLLDEVVIPGLSADTEIHASRLLTLPEAIGADGLYYLMVRIDGDNVIEEEFEGNNLVFARFNLSVGATDDLAAVELLAPPEIVIGEAFEADLAIVNGGAGPLEDVRVKFYLSEADGPADAGGMFIGSLLLDSIPVSASGAPLFVSFSSTIPFGMVEPGQSYMLRAWVDADEQVTEYDELNNEIISMPFLATAGQVDLVGELINPPLEAVWGEGFELMLNVSNLGQIAAAAFLVDVALSTDEIWDESDFYLTSDMIYGLPATPGANTVALHFPIVIPEPLAVGDGTYYLLVNIDGGSAVPEIDEANNVLGATLEITGRPDLGISLAAVANPTNFGLTIAVGDTVTNEGTSSADASVAVNYYLSQDEIWDPQGDVLLGSRSIASLAAGQQNTSQTLLELSQPVDWPAEGQFYLFAVVDPENQIAEAFEDGLPAGAVQPNNLTWMPLQIVGTVMPDLRTDSLTALDDTADWGESVWLEYRIENAGTAPAGPCVATFYLSDNPTITAWDIELGQITLAGLDALGDIEDVAEFVLPAVSPYGTDGEFYIGVMLDSDGQVAEMNEDNNIAVLTESVTVGNVVTVDLLATFVGGPTIGLPGATMELYYEVYNAGSTTAGGFELEFSLRPVAAPEASAIVLGTCTAESLGAGASTYGLWEGVLPAELAGASGEAFEICLRVNPQALENPDLAVVPEKEYGNNQISAVQNLIIAEPILLDAAVVDLQVPAEANWADTLTAQFAVLTSDDWTGPVTVGVYLTSTGWPGNAVWLGQVQVDPAADPATGQLEVTLPAVSPFGRDGAFQIVAVADPDSLVIEQDEANNVSSAPVNIGSGLADLVALSISTDPRAQAGDTIEVYNDIENVGSENAAGFDVYFYLSGDKQLDTAQDTLLGMRHVGQLPSGAVNWTISYLTVPNNTPDGSYYLAMVVDAFDDVPEASEQNNLVFSANVLKIRTITVEPDDYEPNNSASLAAGLTLDDQGFAETVTATLHAQSDRDYYTFTTPANASGFARIVVQPDETLNAALLIYNGSGTQIGGADNDPAYGGQEIFTTFSFAPGRTYSLLVKPMGESLGGYSLDLELGLGAAGDPYEANNTQATAYYLGKAAIVVDDASIHTGTDIDFYRFVIPATSTGQVSLSLMSDPTLDAVLQVFGADGALLASADASGAGAPESLQVAGTVGQSYYARVSSWAQSTGGYELDLHFTAAQMPDAYEPNDTPAAAYPLAAGAVSLSNPGIHTAVDLDYYQLTVPNGTTQIEVAVYASSGLDAGVSLFDADGNLIRFTDRAGVNGAETLLADGLTKGQNLVLLISGLNSTTGRYGLEVEFGNEVVGDFAEPNQTRSSAFPLWIDQNALTLDGLSVHRAEDRDYFQFVAPQLTSGAVTVRIKPLATADELNLSLRLLDAAGTALASTDAGGAGESETLTLASGLLAGQTYYIDVNGWGTTGDYQLQVLTPATQPATADPGGPEPAGYRPNAWGMTSYGFLPSTSPGFKIVEEIGNANDDDLSFGRVPLGTSRTGQIVILNTGSSVLDITQIASSLSVVIVSPTAVSLEAGESQVISLCFTPAQMQMYSDGLLTISYGEDSEYTLPLGGTGTVSTAKPDIALYNSQSNELSGISFAATAVDGVSTYTFLIGNPGAANLTVNSALISGANAGLFQIVQTNLSGKSADDYVINAAGQRAIQVRYRPTATGSHTAVLTLASNDPDEPAVQIPLAGQAVAPNLVVDLNPLDGTVANALQPIVAFGSQVADGPGGQRAEYPITLVNNGSLDLTIHSLSFGGDDSPFRIEGDGIDPEGFVLAAGQSLAAVLVFDPDWIAAGDFAADSSAWADILTVQSNDLDTPMMQFSLSGQAVQAYVENADGPHTFTYTDPDGDVIEVVFGKTGQAQFIFDGDGLTGVNLSSILITGSTGSTSLRITDTNDAGDGIILIGSIVADGAFGSLSVEGSVAEFQAAGAVGSIDVDATLSGLDVGGALGKLNAGGLTGALQAASFGSVAVQGDMLAAVLTAGAGGDGSIQKISVSGRMQNVVIDGGYLQQCLVAGQVSQLAIDAAQGIGSLIFQSDADQVQIQAGPIQKLQVDGDWTDSTVTTTGPDADLGKVTVRGSADNVVLDVAGAVKAVAVGDEFAGQILTQNSDGAIGKVSVGGDWTGDLTAYGSIKKLQIGGQMTGSFVQVLDAGQQAQLKSLQTGGSMDIGALLVQGSLGKLNVGSKQSGADLAGSLTVDDTLKSLRVYGDIAAEVTAGQQLGKVQALGSLLASGSLESSAGNIDQVLVEGYIYGTICANQGQGSINRLTYDERTFRDAETEAVDLPWNHVQANWSGSPATAVSFGSIRLPSWLQ
ncbi:MAG: choice-of-anchor D domain-containing protein, partial [Sedimentisphaerales bacterium]|nr:choice-of-anchor D domain-containing protein [Sedimentisphaerales bacterium]